MLLVGGNNEANKKNKKTGAFTKKIQLHTSLPRQDTETEHQCNDRR